MLPDCRPGKSSPVMVQPDLMHLAFEVDDMAAFVADLEKRASSSATARAAAARAT